MHLADGQTISLVGSIHLLFQYTNCFLFDVDESEDDSKTIAGIGRGKKKDLWSFTKNQAGKEILPEMEECSLQDKKCIVRSFLTYSYRMFYVLPLSMSVSFV